jgi:multidrug efflux pump
MGQALEFLRGKAETLLPEGYSVGYKGASRQYVQEGQALVVTFFFALLTIYLVLAAQFESFRDPLIMLVSVPMSVAGALLAMYWLGLSLNIYTQIGLVTLIGLISKHGILMVEFANHLQEQGRDKIEAIEEAAAIRLRPILMTTAAMVLGVAPLLFAVGPGAVSRFQLGLVIAAGLAVGTLFTLFVVPAFYAYLARRHEGDAEPAPARAG